MTFNELLRNYNDIRYQIKRCISRQQELRELYSFPRRPVGEIHVAGNSDAMVNYIARLTELEKEQAQLENTLFCVRNDIERVLDNVRDFNARRIIELKIFYVNREPTWKYIAKKVGYSPQNTRLLFKNSITYIENLKS